MNFELWLNNLSDFLVEAGIPAENGPMAALGIVFLGVTLLSLVVVLLLLRRNYRVKDVQAGTSVEPVLTEAEAVDGVVEEKEMSSVEEEAPGEDAPAATLPAEEEPDSLYQRMRQGLAKTRSSLVDRMDSLMGSHASLDGEFLE